MRASAQQQGNLHGMADSKGEEDKLIRGTRDPQGEGWAMDAAASSSLFQKQLDLLTPNQSEWVKDNGEGFF